MTRPEWTPRQKPPHRVYLVLTVLFVLGLTVGPLILR
jgi:hypothetical protein